MKGEDAKGLADADKAVALDAKNPNCLGTRAVIYEKLGRRDEAVAGYRASLAADPHHQFAIDGLKRLGVEP
jgi:Flp pilus assembly protein TadD